MKANIQQVFLKGRGVYGSPRVHAALQRQGIACGRKRVVRLMQQMELAAIKRNRKPQTTDSAHDLPIAPNILNRQFTATAPHQRWGGDITAVDTQEGWLYMAALVDLYSRWCVGWAMSSHPDEALVTAALVMASGHRSPTSALQHHTDRGSPNTSVGYRHLLATTGIQASMSRRANCWDNAAIESFWKTRKTACTERSTFVSHQQARTTIFAYLEVFYNRQRLHSTLGYVSPIEFEQPSTAP